jgi:hypothetical protein
LFGLVVSSALLALLLPFELGLITRYVSLDPARITLQNGNLYYYRIAVPAPPLPGLRVSGDTPKARNASSMILVENGRPLGPAHAAHYAIAMLGAGRFSHWGPRGILFSASDNSDPRTNGKEYTAQIRFTPPPGLSFKVGAIFAVLLLVMAGLKGHLQRLCVPVLSRRLKVGTAGDWIAVTIFSAIAYECQALLISPHEPFVLQNTDAGNVASFVAGWIHHDYFASDLVLSDRQNYAFYITAILPLVAFFNIFTQDIGSAYALTYFPLILLQLLGFYLLGRYLFKSTPWAMLLALITFPPVMVFSGEYWGVFHEPLVRMTFGSILPCLILFFLHFGHRRRWLPCHFGLCGASVYAHPVSAPTVALAFWITALATVPPGTSLLRHVVRVVLCGLLFLAAAIPFCVIFFSGFPSLEAAPKSGLRVAERSLSTFYASMPALYYDALTAVSAIVQGLGRTYAYIWLPGLLAFFVIPRLQPEHAAACRFFKIFMAGIFLGSVGVAFADQQISALLGRTPVQVDLVRSVRFEIPILILGCIWLARVVYIRLSVIDRPVARMGSGAIVGLMLVLTLTTWRAWPSRLSEGFYASGARVGLLQGYDPNASEMLAFIRSLPKGSLILPLLDERVGMAVRYGALQPVAYLYKDRNMLTYSSSPNRLKWQAYHEAIVPFVASTNLTQASRRLPRVLRLIQPKYILFNSQTLPPAIGAAVLQAGRIARKTGDWTLVRINAVNPNS